MIDNSIGPLPKFRHKNRLKYFSKCAKRQAKAYRKFLMLYNKVEGGPFYEEIKYENKKNKKRH